MQLTKQEVDYIVSELTAELHARKDGAGKNLIVPKCPFCGKEGGKFGIYIGDETARKRQFMSHCFSCGRTTTTVDQLLTSIGRPDLIPEDKTPSQSLDIPDFYRIDKDEIDDELAVVPMPDGWKRCFRNPYLKSRSFTPDDFQYFPVGTTRGLNFKLDDYVVFPIVDGGDYVGYIGRSVHSKEEIDRRNNRAKRLGKYQMLRYKNSTENDFVKLLYNYDAVVEGQTDTAILVEGVFDCIALTRKLNLYDNHRIVPVATFGKKISLTQIYKLQSKGVNTVVVGYDTDAREGVRIAADELTRYFNVYVANLPGEGKDWDEAAFEDIYDAFAYGVMTPGEYTTQTI